MSITLIISCMKSGKSSELLRLAKRHEIAQRKVLYIKSSIDTRNDGIESRDGSKSSCLVVDKLADVDVKDHEVIAIDECHFFSDLVEYCDKWANDNRILIVTGLDSNFKRESFENVTNLIPKAEKVIKLSAICDICKEEAFFSKRKNDNKELIEVGDKNYISVCRKCYFK